MKAIIFLLIFLLAGCEKEEMQPVPIVQSQQLIVLTPKKVTGICTLPGGQSNAANLKNKYGKKTSGASVLETTLAFETGLPVATLFRGQTGATGSSTVDNVTTKLSDGFIWYYPETGKTGGAYAVFINLLRLQRDSMKTRYGDSIVLAIPWMQGEANARYASARTGAARIEVITRYKAATLAVFKQVRTDMDADVQFFIGLTRPVDVIGATNNGSTCEEVYALQEAIQLIRQAQRELIDENAFVHFGAETTDLVTAREADPVGKADDVFHYSGESYEILATRFAKSIKATIKP